MLQIKSDFSVQRLTRNAVIEYFHNLLVLVNVCETIKQQMSDMYDRLIVAAEALFKAAEQTQKSDLTDPIFQLDSQRDIFWTSLEHAVLAQTKSLDQAIRQAAISVQNTMKSLKVNTNAQYLRESGAMDTVLSVLLGQKLEAVTAIGLLPLVNQLNEVNDAMHRLLEERNAENSGKPAAAFENTRRTTEDTYRDFVRFVNAWWIINVDAANRPDADLQNFIVQTNTLIDQYICTQKLSASTSTDKEEGGAEGEDEPTDTPTTDPTNPPTTDPDEDENEDEQTGGGEQGGGTQQPGGDQNGGGTNTPSGPNTDAWGDGDEGDGSDV